MKIIEVKISILPARLPMFKLEVIPGLRRVPWVNRGQSENPGFQQVMHVQTDEGIDGVCTGSHLHQPMTKETLEQLRVLVVGEDPLDRERLYQKLHTGTRWIYRQPGWAGTFDNCLWDIAGKAANLPVYSVIGRVRDKIPAYQNIRYPTGTKEDAVVEAKKAVARGFTAVKDHYYHPVEENIQWFRAVREAVGPDIDIMHDAVTIYTFEEAVRVGHVLEELNYRWFEEPLFDRQQNKLKALCEALDIPILAPEMMMNDVDLCAQWLISGATDLVRASAVYGVTPVLKLAHLAELHGTNVELNGPGGLFGLVHAHLLCCIFNTSYYEFSPSWGVDEASKEIGMSNPPLPVDGYIAPPTGPGWGAEWDWDYFKKNVVAEY